MLPRCPSRRVSTTDDFDHERPGVWVSGYKRQYYEAAARTRLEFIQSDFISIPVSGRFLQNSQPLVVPQGIRAYA
jgi:hypothetical protein